MPDLHDDSDQQRLKILDRLICDYDRKLQQLRLEIERRKQQSAVPEQTAEPDFQLRRAA